MSINRLILRMRFIFLTLGLFLAALCLRCGGGSNTAGSSNSPAITPVSAFGCGDAKLESGEGCDDGNWENSDGCNIRCGLEVGEAICGNGVKENEECCDDGNTNNGDGCSDRCTNEVPNQPPSAPVLGDQPSDGVTWAPTRLYLSWLPSVDGDPGDTVVYDVYFVEGNGVPNDALAYRSGASKTHFIVQSSTDNRSEFFPDKVIPLYLKPLQTYSWKICARDSRGASACSQTRIFNTDNSVVGWWRFDENTGGGGTYLDSSGKSNNAAVFSEDADNTLPGADILGQAFFGDGANDYSLVSASPSIDSINSTNFSLEMRAKTASPSSVQSFIWRGDGSMALTNKFYAIQIISNQVRFSHRASGNDLDTRTITGTTPVLPNSWFHIVAIRNLGTSLQIYRDSVSDAAPVADNANTFDWTGFTRPLSFGATYEGVSPIQLFNGAVDEILIYNISLSPEEMWNNYHSSLP